MKNAIKFIIRKTGKMSVFLKITLLIEAVFIVLFVVSFSVTTSLSEKLIKEKEIALNRSRIEKMSAYVQEKADAVDNLFQYIHTDNISKRMADIANEINDPYDIGIINEFQSFLRLTSSGDTDICDVMMISLKGSLYSYTIGSMPAISPSYPFLEDQMILEFLKEEEIISIPLSSRKIFI